MLTTHDSGMRGTPDPDQLAHALREGRVMVTQDDDFLRLHANGLEHAGIVYSHQGTPVGTFLRGLMLITEILDAEDMAQHVEFL